MTRRTILVGLAIAIAAAGVVVLSARQEPGGSAPAVAFTGELRQWHKVTLTVTGPQADEAASSPNPFLDYRMTVTFVHESGSPSYTVPGYFAADGHAGETSATSGNQWRAHFAPDKNGRWDWRMAFVSGKDVAVDASQPVTPVAPWNGSSGRIQIGQSDKVAPDFRARGRLLYVGRRYLQFQGTGEFFLKAGADAPETLLAFQDFDGTVARKPQVPLHTFAPHVADWKKGDPTWKNGKGKGLIGAINYLASAGANAMSFLTYNAGGDGDNVWPFVDRDDKRHYDVSKLDQWQVVFDHAQHRGVYLHFKLEETENDDNRIGNPYQAGRGGAGAAAGTPATTVAVSLDGGGLGIERRLYIRELVARFGYLLALNWNLGEENTLSTTEQQLMAQYIASTDPYRHNIVLHTYPEDAAQDAIYTPLLGGRSALTGASIQTEFDKVHQRTLRWVEASEQAGKPWVVANDEQGNANFGTPPDLGYKGFTGKDAQGRDIRTVHDIRKYTLWGNLMAGGAGVEYYFGYQLPDNDLTAENFRSRAQTWRFSKNALEFFRNEHVPFWDMVNADALIGNFAHDNSRYAFAEPGAIYLVYLPTGGTTSVDLTGASGLFTIRWFDPRDGGGLKRGSVSEAPGGAPVSLGNPPNHPTDDWLVVVRRQ